jgi:hypothetical protein
MSKVVKTTPKRTPPAKRTIKTPVHRVPKGTRLIGS